ncbi:MAG: hypothetical protein J7578_17595 [Chitinophagaceae bacterium]|nr:hypothetical protein [Chitinophagaceae bacterium]
MKRIILFATIILSAVMVHAQSPLLFGPSGGMQPAFPHFNQKADTNSLGKKWSLTKYAAVSAGFMGLKGGNANFLSAPMGVQLNRQLTNNVFAFAGVSVTPAYFHYNSPLYQPVANMNMHKGFMNGNNFDVYPAAQMGLMYINNERTFSISGSIGVSRSYYNYYQPSFYNPAHPAIPGKSFNKF